jgi:BirA family transcriptional regulator, biotin operon repressor / biotin---[acetyl-CoA-carboxylase] ligase
MVVTMVRSTKNSRLRILSKLQILFYLQGIIMQQTELFSILDSVESTNNYAMQQVHAGLAKNGQAWFAQQQWGGKGQRGKIWESATGENIILSIAILSNKAFSAKPFYISALVACECRKWFAAIAGTSTKIKWPNDIYWGDNKAGGILIENIFKGKALEWSIIGIGINVNQMLFDEAIANPTSLKIITGETYNPVELAKDLHAALLYALGNVLPEFLHDKLDYYNKYLYKKNEQVTLKKDNAVFKTNIRGVNEYGQLLTEDVIERTFEFGEVSWVM